jgi:hypothetical protein
MPPYTTDRPRHYDNVRKPASGCKRAGWPAQRGIQHLAQPLAIKRFYQQLVQSGVERGLAVFLDIGGECKHVRPFAAGWCFRGTDAARRSQAIHTRHLHVHQQQIVRFTCSACCQPGFHGRLSITCNGWKMAATRRQRARLERVDHVILSHQDRQPFDIGKGRCFDGDHSVRPAPVHIYPLTVSDSESGFVKYPSPQLHETNSGTDRLTVYKNMIDLNLLVADHESSRLTGELQ